MPPAAANGDGSKGADDLAPQIEALRAAGCKRIYSEKRSGADTNRAALARLPSIQNNSGLPEGPGLHFAVG
jgi:hypothetical protein